MMRRLAAREAAGHGLTNAAIAVALAAAVLLGAAPGRPGGPAATQAAPVLAPDFHLPLLGGGTVSLASFKGKPAILLFWAPW